MKRIYKRIFSIFLLLTFIFSLASCNSSQEKKKENLLDKKSNYLGLVINSFGGSNNSREQLFLNGLKKAEADLGFKIEYLESNSDEEIKTNIDYFTDCNLDMLFCIGYEMADYLEDIAYSHPDKNYTILNYSFDEKIDNVLCVEFKDNQVAFEAGYLAAQKTQTNRVGFLGNFRSEEIDAFEYGFKAGVDFAAKELNKEIFVDIDYIDSFDDKDLAKKDADKIYESGADIIYSVVGKSIDGVISSAIEHKNFIIVSEIAQDSLDQRLEKVVLASTVRNIDNVIYDIAKEIKQAKEVSDITGKTKFLGLKEDAVKLLISKNNINSEDLTKKLENIEQGIKKNKIEPPYDEETYEEYIKNI